MEDDAEGELRNPFPSPPSIYKRYTTQNLKLLALLKARQPEEDDATNQADVLSDQPEVPSFDLRTLEPPRVDWIVEEGHYSVFGDPWFVTEHYQSLKDAGGNQLFPDDPSVDRRPALHAILRTLLASYLKLLSAVVQPPLTTSAFANNPNAAPDWVLHVEWMHTMGQNIMAAANDMRPAQARANVEALLGRQLEQRKAETRKLHERCDALEETLAALQAKSSKFLDSKRSIDVVMQEVEETNSTAALLSSDHSAMLLGNSPLGPQDVLAWADMAE